MTLYDFIDKKPMLKRLYNILEFGISTSMLNFLLAHLNEFEIGGTQLTADHITHLKKNVFDDMVSKKYSLRECFELANIINICGVTAVGVQDEKVHEKDINMDWAARFFDYSKDCGDSETQLLWSKILYKELNNPGSVFKRTLSVLYSAEKFELDWFYEMTKIAFDRSCIPDFVLHENKYLAFNKFQTLVDLGLVNPTSASIAYINKTDTLRFTSCIFKIEIANIPYNMGVYTLTDAGTQLFDLRELPADDNYIQKVREKLEAGNNVKVLEIEPIKI